MIKTETTALKLSVYANSSLAIFALVLAWYSRSIVILMELSFIAVTLVMSLVTVRISRLLDERPSQKYPFGFTFLEPFLNLFKGGLLSIIALYSAWISLQALFSEPEPIDSVLPIIYGGGTSLVCACVAILQRQALKHFNSPLLKLEMIDFGSSAGIAFGILVAFSIGEYLSGTKWETYTAYIDPLTTILIVLLVMPVFWTIIKESARSLLQIGHNMNIEKQINGLLDDLTDFPPCEVFVQEIGRRLYIIIALKVAKKYYQQTLGPIMEARKVLNEKIAAYYPGAIVHMILE
jgi:predicted Co/Zn/Cd cation transporter (cation efflux family)